MGLTTRNSLQDWRLHVIMTPGLFVDLAIQFVNVIHENHQIQGTIGNLHPSQIYISSNGSLLSWSGYVGERQLPYMAPEQLDIMNRKPDIRSDLYTMGIILYELLTGRYPYASDLGKDGAHIHLYEEACAYDNNKGPHEVYIDLIIQKLLKKSPDDRYQTAYGVLYDLKQLETAIQQDHNLISIGEGDSKQSFQLLNYQLKHENELNQLEALRQQLKHDPYDDLHMVYGDKGIGKTTFLNQYQDLLEEQNNNVIVLNCSPHEADPHYYIKELQSLFLQKLLEQDSNTLNACTALLKSELGEAIAQWVQFVPSSLKLWDLDTMNVSKQTMFDEKLCLKALIILCQYVNPAVIIIDQLEYIDQESYVFLCKLVQNKPYDHLMIVAACQRTVFDKRFSRNSLTHLDAIEIPSLSYVQIREWVVHACQEDSIRISQLSLMVYHWSHGNPDYIISLFHQWQQQKIFYYDEQIDGWQWHAGSMSNLAHADGNWKTFMNNLTNLPVETVEYLKIASVFGVQFSIESLAQIIERDFLHVKQQLNSARMEGIIAYLDETSPASTSITNGTISMFLMNELREHIYQSMEAHTRANLHMRIGMNQECKSSETAIYHLNHAIQVLSAEQTVELARLNFERGMRTYQGEKFKQAAADFKCALQALDQHDAKLPELKRRIILYLSISLACCNEIAESKQYFKRVENDLSQLDDDDYLTACMHQLEFNTFHKNKKAVAAAEQGLRKFGVEAEGSSNLLNAFVQTALTLHKVRAYRRDLPSIKLCEEKAYYAQCKIMWGQFFALLSENPVQLLISYSKFIRYGLKKGINDALVEMISAYEIVIQRVFSFGYPYWPKDMFKQLILLLPSQNNESFRSMYLYSMVQQLEVPFEADAGLLKTIHASLESETLFVNLATLTFIVCNQGKISQLEAMLRIFEDKNNHLFNISTLHYKKYMVDYYNAWQREDQLYSYIRLQENGEPEDIDNFIAIQRAEQAYLAGEYEIGMKWIQCARTKELEPDWIRNRKLRMYEALLAAALYPSSEGKLRGKYKGIVLRCTKKMKGWQGAYGFESSSYYLLNAEANRMRGRMEQALHDYELAVKQAKAEEHWLLQGIVYERQAYAYRDKGFDSGFMISLVDALSAYRKWGAQAKVEQLRKKYPQLIFNTVSGESSDKDEIIVDANPQLTSIEQNQTNSMMVGSAQLAWQWLDNIEYKQDSDRALNKLLEMIQQQTGAERGLLLQLDQDQYNLIASTETIEDEIPLQTIAVLPILRYVNRTDETILLGDAGTSRYKTNKHIQAHEVKSLLCMTVKLQVKSNWLLYLENRTISDVFSNQTVEMIQLIVTRYAYLQFMNQAEQPGESTEVSRSTNPSKPATAKNDKGGLVESLTNRELEVLQLLCSGSSNKDIAKQLFVGESTVKTHVYNIYGKLGVKRRTQAIRRAEELNLLK